MATKKQKRDVQDWGINTSSHVQILGLGTDLGDAAPSVLLFFDKQRYVFNAGEGFQRFCVQHQIKMNRISDVLLTRLSTDACGGLPGMCLTQSDTLGGYMPGKEPFKLNIYGPKGAGTLVAALNTFIDTRAIAVGVHEFGQQKQRLIALPKQDAAANGEAQQQLQPVVANELVTITPVQLDPAHVEIGSAEEGAAALPPAGKRAKTELGAVRNGKGPPEVRDDTGGAPDQASTCQVANGGASAPKRSLEAVPARRQHKPRTWLEDGEAPPLAAQAPAACYVCQLAATPGRFLPEKAAALGVPKGPLFGRLKAGQPVQAADGRTVQPSEVLEEGTPGARVVIVDCPSPQYLLPLLASAALKLPEEGEAAQEGSKAIRLQCIIHLTPAEVLALPEYVEWAASFGPAAHHIMAAAGHTAGDAVMRSAASMQARLNALQPSIFPLHHSLPRPDLALPQPNMTPGRNLLRFHLRPRRDEPLDDRDVPAVFDAAAEQDSFRAEQAPLCASLARSKAEASLSPAPMPDCIETAGRESLEILFLGTGAAMPSKYRNVTAMYLHLFARGGMLLDCGEGTYGQLRRRYGAKGADNIVSRLRAVWISHIHADHHAGLARILAVRTRMLGPEAPPLPVIGPRPLRRVLAAVAQLEPMAFRYVDTLNTVPDEAPQGNDEVAATLEGVKQSLGLTQLDSFRVVHCAHAFGCVLRSRDGWSLALSGDTRPCDAVVAAAKDATVLVHEATFGSERTGSDGAGEYMYGEEAEAKRHSMTHEAVEVGRRAGVYRTILSHFSQRYPKIPVVDSSFAASTCIAFDLMAVNLADLPTLPVVVPALQQLFKEPEEGNEA